MTDHRTHALRAAEIGAEIARRHFRGRLGIEFKADESPVTEADKAVEAEIRRYLTQHFPDHGILGEEHGIEGADASSLWVIDPIDGTRSFLSGHPLFGLLLAYMEGGRPKFGIIGMPALHETFAGSPGEGASLNGTPIRVSGQRNLDRAILFINEGEKIYRDRPAVFDRLMSAGQTRRLAYDCYPHALLAAGHVDAVVDYDLQPYDYLPVSAVVEGAGGIMTDWQGKPLTLTSDGCVVTAATPELHSSLLPLLNG
jgi:histidinol phosphatase-like enzyme (inositol monophosphatase family)